MNRSDVSTDILRLEQHNGDNDDYDESVISNAITEAIQSGKIKSYGGVSIWNGSAFKQFKIIRLVLRKETWLCLPFRWSLAVGLTTVSGLWWKSLARRMLSCYRENNHTQGYWWWPIAVLSIETLAATITSIIMYKSYRFFRFIIGRDTSRLTAQAFAPFCSGPTGIDCLRGALAKSKNYSRETGRGLWIMNVAESHPDCAAFGKRGFGTRFLQKWLTMTPNDTTMTSVAAPSSPSAEWKLFSPAAFLDPRDH